MTITPNTAIASLSAGNKTEWDGLITTLKDAIAALQTVYPVPTVQSAATDKESIVAHMLAQMTVTANIIAYVSNADYANHIKRER